MAQQSLPASTTTTGVRQGFLLSTDFLLALGERELSGLSEAAKRSLARLQQLAKDQKIVIAQVSLEQLFKRAPNYVQPIREALEEHHIQPSENFVHNENTSHTGDCAIHEAEVWIASQENLALVAFVHPELYEELAQNQGFQLEILTEKDIANLQIPIEDHSKTTESISAISMAGLIRNYFFLLGLEKRFNTQGILGFRAWAMSTVLIAWVFLHRQDDGNHDGTSLSETSARGGKPSGWSRERSIAALKDKESLESAKRSQVRENDPQNLDLSNHSDANSNDWDNYSSQSMSGDDTDTLPASPNSPLKLKTPNNPTGNSTTIASQIREALDQDHHSGSPQQSLKSIQANMSQTNQNQFRADHPDVLAIAVDTLLNQGLQNYIPLVNPITNGITRITDFPSVQTSASLSQNSNPVQEQDLSNPSIGSITGQLPNHQATDNPLIISFSTPLTSPVDTYPTNNSSRIESGVSLDTHLSGSNSNTNVNLASSSSGSIPNTVDLEDSANNSFDITPDSKSVFSVLTVGERGQVSIDYSFNGGVYHSELGISGLDELQQYPLTSQAPIQEILHQVMNGPPQEDIVIADAMEGTQSNAEFDSNLSFYPDKYLNIETFAKRPNEQRGVVPISSPIQEDLNNSVIGSDQQSLFSIVSSSPNESLLAGQIADVTGLSHTFPMEDQPVNGNHDRNYDNISSNIIFQIVEVTNFTTQLNQGISLIYGQQLTSSGRTLVQSIGYEEPRWLNGVIGQSLMANTQVAKAFPVSPDLANTAPFSEIDGNYQSINTNLNRAEPIFLSLSQLTNLVPGQYLVSSTQINAPQSITTTQAGNSSSKSGHSGSAPLKEWHSPATINSGSSSFKPDDPFLINQEKSHASPLSTEMSYQKLQFSLYRTDCRR